jgi:hypothetical protein
LIDSTETLRKKFLELLRWQKRKRHVQVAAAIACYSLAGPLLFLPFSSLLPEPHLRWLVPIPFIILSAPLIFYRQRWRRPDSVRSLALVDRLLGLEERAVTAWELADRKETRASELLVLSAAAERLAGRDLHALLPAQPSWQHFAAPVLLIAWIVLAWFDVNLLSLGAVSSPSPKNMAQQLRDFSRDLQQRAASEGLRETLKLGRELEKAAQKAIGAKTSDEQFKQEIVGMNAKLRAAGVAAAKEPSLSSAETEQSLKDLKAEVEAAQEPLPSGNGGMNDAVAQQWLDRMASLPQLKRQFEQQRRGGQSFSQNEMKSFLDKLNQQVTGELDRRSLLDAQQFLDQMAKGGQRQAEENNARMSGRGNEEDGPAGGEKTQNQSSLPGKELGNREEVLQALRQFPDLPATHLKGSIGEGSSSAVEFKGRPTTGGHSVVSQDDVIASYRRQAEQELNTEAIPEELKETVKKYFMSLENNANK